MATPDYRTKHFRKRTDETPKSSYKMPGITRYSRQRFVIQSKALIEQKLKLK